eukprot:CAMPEP_0182892052 /NCGR_PEP_ID=MMETSP0034_2-20130328/23636_1 /TAXON_ID=156128 /ORGANISM="Nephroselmis pyriformis, Strain CCMP717" /LENGTH=130 /DNA_ID=CAMNT_0025025697 /DNA_START=39 /DNA_END=428 /DNA_ORIENTATION=+
MVERTGVLQSESEVCMSIERLVVGAEHLVLYVTEGTLDHVPSVMALRTCIMYDIPVIFVHSPRYFPDPSELPEDLAQADIYAMRRVLYEDLSAHQAALEVHGLALASKGVMDLLRDVEAVPAHLRRLGLV